MHSDSLPITGPCPIDLDAIGFDRTSKVSHCRHCSKTVTILSNMTRGEAQQFLRRNQGKKRCVSYARDEQGRIRFREQPSAAPDLVPVTRLRRSEAAPSPRPPVARGARAAGMAVAFGLSAAMAACTPHQAPAAGEVVVAGSRGQPETPLQTSPQTSPQTPLAGDVAIPDDLNLDGEIAIPELVRTQPAVPCDPAIKPRVEPAVEPPMLAGQLAVPEVIDPPKPPERMLAGAAVMPVIDPRVKEPAPARREGPARRAPPRRRGMSPL